MNDNKRPKISDTEAAEARRDAARAGRAAARTAYTGVSLVGKILLTVFLVGILSAAICGSVFYIYVERYLTGSFDVGIDDYSLNYTSFIYYTDESTGELVEYEQLYGEQNRVWADYSEIPQDLKDAYVAIEDERFWTHDGVDWKRTLGAGLSIVTGRSYGGSTITQQLIKNITGDNEVSFKRKLLEIFRALYLEREVYSKEQILELYLNTINMSQGCYGVKSAARVYFNKEVSQLTLAECASLAGITNLPTYYDPFQNPDNNKERQLLILAKMYELGMITEEEYRQAQSEQLVFAKTEYEQTVSSKQSYFADYVIEQVIGDLVEEKGYNRTIASRLVYTGGLKIVTTLDPRIQSIVDSVYNDDANFPVYDGPNQPESAMVVMDIDGDVVAMIGGRGEKTVNRAWNRATDTKRQPGSTMKPLTSYAPAIEYGLITPYSVLDDSPVMVYNNKPWPRNYYSGFRGLMTVMAAVQDSSNPPSVRLVQRLGAERCFSFGASNLGLTSLVREKTVNDRTLSDIDISPMALGGLTDGVSVLEMAAAYATFANKGIYTVPRVYTQVYDSEGNLILDNQPVSNVAMKEKTAYYMNRLLTNVVEKGSGVRARFDNMTIAGKTGTTSTDNDRWFVGYTPYYSCAAWIGFDTAKSLNASTNPIVPVWKQVMEAIHAGLEYAEFDELDDVVKATYCADSGMKPTEYCALDPRGSRLRTGYYLKEDTPTGYCTIHVPVVIDEISNQLATEYCPYENRKTIALLNYRHDVDGITTPDSGLFYYLGTAAGTAADELDTEEASTTDGDAVTVTVNSGGAYNTYCELHREPPVVEPPAVEPPAVEPPEEEIPPEDETPSEGEGGEILPPDAGIPDDGEEGGILPDTGSPDIIG